MERGNKGKEEAKENRRGGKGKVEGQDGGAEKDDNQGNIGTK